MTKKIYISKKDPIKLSDNNRKIILNFLNLHDIWWFFNNDLFNKHLSQEPNINFPDGKMLSRKLNIKQKRGPSITREILLSKKAKAKKHFFVGTSDEDLKRLSEISKIPTKNLKNYDLPFIKEIEFPLEERGKLIKTINKFKPHYLWISIGCPKQVILANQIFKEANARSFMAVGAAIDFFVGKKKGSPKIFTKLGVEWLYRLVTDFKHSKKKVWRHLVALRYLKRIEVKK